MTARHGSGESCREMFARLSEYIDGELPDDLCARIERHMGDCTPCERFLESLRRTVRLVESDPAETLPDDVRRELARLASQAAD